MNLASVADRLAAMGSSAVTLEAGRCLHSTDRYSTCELCLGVCPANAIAAGHPPALNTEACQTCLACLPVCPTGAYRASDAVPALLECVARSDVHVLELICARHPAPALGLADNAVAIRVRGCLAGLGVSAYLALAALGVERVVARTEACRDCAWAALHGQIEAQVAQAARLLAPWERPDALSCVAVEDQPARVPRPVWDADNPPLSRRDLLRLASRRGQVMLARAVTEEAPSAAHRPSRERQRVITALAHLPAPPATGETAGFAAGPGFATLAISEACTACGACARACPTGALQFEQDDRPGFRLTFAPQACIGCAACQHVCAPAAVTVDPQPTWEAVFGPLDPVVLREGGLVRCSRCHAWMAAPPGLAGTAAAECPTCAFRRQNPFGTRTIPGLTRVRS